MGTKPETDCRAQADDEMSRYKWSLLSLLFVIMAPPSTGAAVIKHSAVVVKIHRDATLHCAGLKNTSCSAIFWTFQSQKSPDIVVLLQNGLENNNKTNLHPIKLLPNCSISFSNVTEQHVGLYSCSRSAVHTPLHTVSLSVVKASERNNCSLLSAEPEQFTFVRSELVPPITLTPSLKFVIKDQKLHCHVLDRFTRKTWKIHLSNKDLTNQYQTPAPNVTIVPNITTAPNTAAPSANGFTYKQVLCAVVIAFFSAALLTLVCVTVLCWRRKAKLSQGDICHAEEEPHYSSVHFEKTPNRGPKAEEKEEDLNTTVVYSSVRTPPVHTDPSALYATVNKPKKASG